MPVYGACPLGGKFVRETNDTPGFVPGSAWAGSLRDLVGLVVLLLHSRRANGHVGPIQRRLHHSAVAVSASERAPRLLDRLDRPLEGCFGRVEEQLGRVSPLPEARTSRVVHDPLGRRRSTIEGGRRELRVCLTTSLDRVLSRELGASLRGQRVAMSARALLRMRASDGGERAQSVAQGTAARVPENVPDTAPAGPTAVPVESRSSPVIAPSRRSTLASPSSSCAARVP